MVTNLYKDNHFDELRSLIFENAWVKYFEPIGRINNTWISFEAEISRVVQLLDNYRKSTDKNERRQIFMGQLFPVYGRMEICDKDNICSISDEIIINKLLVDLGRLIRCLEIYLCLCSKTIRITNKLQAVLKIGTVDKVLSFNYTDTFENVYQPLLEKAPEYCYIHGHAKLSNTIDSNNMVLGIDEYLDENVRNEETTFVCFKKFYQRIFKQTDFNYMNWVNKRAGTKDLYIIGHSLDVTDKKVLQDILTQPGVHTTIFYHTKSANGD